jgi:hypothetical protein
VRSLIKASGAVTFSGTPTVTANTKRRRQTVLQPQSYLPERRLTIFGNSVVKAGFRADVISFTVYAKQYSLHILLRLRAAEHCIWPVRRFCFNLRQELLRAPLQLIRICISLYPLSLHCLACVVSTYSDCDYRRSDKHYSRGTGQFGGRLMNRECLQLLEQNCILWGAQLEQSTTVGEYIPTTSTINSAPRFDHDPTTGESLGLLVEESRTNLTEESSDFSTTWTTQFGATVSTVSGYTNPDGTSTVYKLTQATHSFAGLRDTHNFSAGDHTFSIYVRSVSGTAEFRLKLYDGTSDTFTGTLTATEEWQRFSITKTCASGGGNYQISNITSPNTDEMLVWGAQLEVGSKATSYIPTEGVAVTRAADVASISGSNFSSWYRQDEGTVFAAYQGREGNASKRVFAFTDDSFSNNAWLIASNSVGSQANYWQVQAGGVVQAELGSGAYSVVPQLSAAAYRADDFGFSKNGNAPLTDTSGSIPVVNTLRIGAGPVNTGILNGTIRRLTFWPTRLPNETLQNITQ